jgi:hypothetical protein
MRGLIALNHRIGHSDASTSPRGRAAWLALAGAVALVASACGSATTSSPSAASATSASTAAATSAAATTPAAPVASAHCPASSAIGSALGVTAPPATTVPGASALPAGASGVVCNYLTPSFDVLVEVFVNITPAFIARGEQQINAHTSSVTFSPVSGVGDTAYSYHYSLGAAGTAEGVLAVKGTTFVAVSATRTPASLSQVEALVNQLLS